MADKDIIREGITSVEVYRSNDAAPANWDDAKFWLINELRRIQSGFFSVDEVLSNLDLSGGSESGSTGSEPGPVGPQGPEGPEGPQGPTGPQGPAGADGTDIIADYKTALDFTWSSQKIVEYINQQFNTDTTGGSNVTIGATVPDNASSGDLFYDNATTFNLYVYDGEKWLATVEDQQDLYVQRNIPTPGNPLKPFMWIQTGMGDDGYGYSVWFNDPEF